MLPLPSRAGAMHIREACGAALRNTNTDTSAAKCVANIELRSSM